MGRIRFALLAVLSIGLKIGGLAQTFNGPPLLPTAFDPAGVAAGDFNRDGNPDLVYVDGASQATTLHVLLGRGDGTFSHGQDVALPSGICVVHCTINVADVSADGILDLIMGGNNALTGEVAVLLGKGDGTFQAPIVSNLASTANSFPALGGTMAVGDFNGDGAPDLALGDPVNNAIYVLLGNKSGSFTPGVTLPQDVASSDLHAVDLNHDGHLDLVALGGISSGGFTVHFGNGDGTFQSPVLYQVGAGFKGFLVDVDGDGQPDVLAELNTTGTLTQIIVLKGNPDGSFAAPVVIGQLPSNVSLIDIGDFNGDGLVDLEVSNLTGIGILLGQPGLSFGPMITSLSGGSPRSFPSAPAQADLNKDGHLDLAVLSDGGITLLLGKGDGTFANGGAQIYDVGNPVATLAVADFNGDKLPDIAVVINAAVPRLLLGQPGGTFVLAPDPNTTHGSGPGTIGVGDFNGDGNNDLSLGPIGSASPTVLFGDGHGGFSAPLTVANGSPDIADFNRDGRSDMVNVNLSPGSCTQDCPMSVALGQTNETFVTANTTLLGIIFAAATAIGDLNGDGIPDLVVTGDGVLQVWLGKGDGTFSQGVSVNVPGFTGGFGLSVGARGVVTDLDGDGKNDVVLTPFLNLSNPNGSPPALMILYGKGDGTFESPVLVPLSHFYNHVTVADLNRDNRPDLILDDGFGIAVMLNLGNRTFEDESHFVAGTSIAGLTAVDVNGDGFPDLVVANPGANTVVVLLSNPTGTPPGGLHPLVGLSIAPEPSSSGTAFTATASVAAPNATSPAPTGSVDFILDGTFAGTVSLASGTASFTITSTLTPGLHEMVAAYSGDQVYAMASAYQKHTVTPPVFPTQTVLAANPATVLTSQTLHLVATVSATGGTPCLPPSNICSWGTVTFFDGTQTLAAQPADNGSAVFDTSLLAAGTHSLSAMYHGFSNSNEIFLPSTSAPVTVTVNSTATVTTATLSAGTVTAGSVVTLGASVTSSTGTPFGGVTFFDGNVPLGTMSLQANGTASFNIASLSVGTHNISAGFNANATFAGSTSSQVTLVVQAPPGTAIPTFAALSATLHPENGSVVFQATIVAERGLPQSTVVFLDGGAILGKALTDPAGVAVLTVPLPNHGPHSFRGSFSGNSQFAPSVSPELQELWPDSGPGFSLSVNPAIVRFDGVAGETEITIAGAGALEGPAQLACTSGLPAGYACSFEPQSLSPGGTSRLSIHPSLAARRGHLLNEATRGFALVTLFVFGMLVFPRRRPLLLMMLCCAGLYALSGCGAAFPEHPQISVVTIQGISGTGSSQAVHSNQIVFVVPDQH